jgi:uncharacterized protein (DUF4415 family)
MKKQFASFHYEKHCHMNENDMSNTSRTDWARIDAMTDEEIDTSDIPPLSDEFFAKAKLRLPGSSEATVAVRIDAKTLEWFQSQGEEAEKQMTAAFRELTII